jgi:hypothetical protein
MFLNNPHCLRKYLNLKLSDRHVRGQDRLLIERPLFLVSILHFISKNRKITMFIQRFITIQVLQTDLSGRGW